MFNKRRRGSGKFGKLFLNEEREREFENFLCANVMVNLNIKNVAAIW